MGNKVAQYTLEILDSLPELDGRLAVADLGENRFYGSLDQSALSAYPDAVIIGEYKQRTWEENEGAWAVSQPQQDLGIIFYRETVAAT